MLTQPIRFQPLFRRYIWGGRRLGTTLAKPIGEGNDYAESWEVVDHGDDQSVVKSGFTPGTTLSQLVKSHGPALLGTTQAVSQFPLLFKFLDCNRDLSIQVHPNDAQAREQTPPDLGKTEAWVILDAAPGSIAYVGLKEGIDRQQFEQALRDGSVISCMNALRPRAGDCIFVPAGVVHALGAGFLVAEIQQASDTTFRLFDWNRVDAQGKPRPLHIEQGLRVTDFTAGPRFPQTPQLAERYNAERLVACDKFVLDRWRIEAETRLPSDGRCHILAVLSGSVVIAGEQPETPLTTGETALIPANCQKRWLEPQEPTVLLDIYLPTSSR